MGKSRSFEIGMLKYETPSTVLTLPFIVGIAIGAAVLVIFIVVIIVAYRKKSLESDKAVKRMQNQMDVLEAKVAKECKEGKGRWPYGVKKVSEGGQGV